MAKSADAFRTISEVADWLGIQAHVLRFWESKFTQVKPIKRAGGRRYYRPADMLLLGGIKKLLHGDGLTIKGVQKILREEGMSYVSALSIPLDEDDQREVDETAQAPSPVSIPDPTPEPVGVVLPFDGEKDIKNAPEVVENTNEVAEPEPVAAQPTPAPQAPEPEVAPEPEPSEAAKLPSFLNTPLSGDTEEPATDNTPPDPEPATAIPEPVEATPEAAPEPTPEPSESAPKPRVVDLPAFTAEADFPASPSLLSKVARTHALTPYQATKIKPILAQLTALRDQMASKRSPTPGA